MRTSVTALAIVVAIGLTGGTAVSAAHAQDPATDTAATESKADKSKKICRSIVKSGTRFSQRICRSKEDWDKDTEAAARYLEKGQNYGSSRNEGITNVP